MKSPALFQIELTNHCNLACKMCPHSKMTRQKGYMSLGLFKKIVDESVRLRWPVHWLHHFGEPLLFPRLREALIYLKKNSDWNFGISTNCVALNEKNRELLYKHARRVRLCIDSTRKRVYEQLRGENYEIARNNAIAFLDLVEKRDSPEIEIQILNTRLNPNEHYPDNSLFFHKKAIQYPDTPNFSFTKKVCDPKKRNELCILWTGELSWCCHDYNGENIFAKFNGSIPLNELWKKEKVFNLCKRCPYFNH